MKVSHINESLIQEDLVWEVGNPRFPQKIQALDICRVLPKEIFLVLSEKMEHGVRLWHLLAPAKGFSLRPRLLFPCGEDFKAVWAHFRPFLCTVVTLITLSSDLSKF